MFYFRRNDAYLRNEWSNYTNWPYTYTLPNNIVDAPLTLPPDYNSSIYGDNDASLNDIQLDTVLIGPGLEKNGTRTDLYITPVYSNINEKHVLQNLGILIDGNYRENLLDSNVYNFAEKYTRTNGDSNFDLYCYNFALESSPFILQPSGAINFSFFNKIELEFTTLIPQLDENAIVYTLKDTNGNIIGVNKPSWIIYDYTFDLFLIEEKYNVLTIVGGNAGLMFSY